MKKIGILLLGLFPALGFTHGQSPIIYGGKKDLMKAIVLDQNTFVPITLSLSKSETGNTYDFKVDGKYVMSVENAKNEQKVNIPVHMNKPEKPESHTICSHSNTDKNATELVGPGPIFRITICTKANLIWLK